MRSKITVAITLLVSILIIGVLGFKFVQGLSWVDAIYMTVITISTVGYREVELPNDQTKIFIVLLLLFSVVMVGYSVSVITEYVRSRGSLKDMREK
ncbi:two pore domain potassium channel family protein, partial [Nonlabens mediterrranea]|nr:two pore domain potassium channel family protein [Nonlabens mediterrranea]